MSYSTTLEASAYFTGTSNEAVWDAIDEPTQGLLLEDASRYIDSAFDFSGTQTDELLAFPRASCVNSCTGTTYADTEVPTIVKNANAEIALKMSVDNSLTTGEIGQEDYNIKSEQVDTIAVTYKDDSSAYMSSDPYGTTWLKCILNDESGSSTGGMVSARIVKG